MGHLSVQFPLHSAAVGVDGGGQGGVVPLAEARETHDQAGKDLTGSGIEARVGQDPPTSHRLLHPRRRDGGNVVNLEAFLKFIPVKVGSSQTNIDCTG